MRILYLGDMSDGATSAMRMAHLPALGHQVRVLDTRYRHPSGIALRGLSRLRYQLGYPLDVGRINDQLLTLATTFVPNLVWVDKGLVVRRSTLQAVRRRIPDVKLIHYNPDDPFGAYGRRGWRTFIQAISAYDSHFVPRRENILEYRAHGATRVLHNVPTRGFDPDVHRPYGRSNELAAAFCADVGFLGAPEPVRSASLLRLASTGIPVRLMSDWPQGIWHEKFLRAPFPVHSTAYAKAIGSFKIALGFLRKANRDQHTSRSIEIPACGTFLLAERTEEHLALFQEGREAEFFGSDEELIEKVHFYLRNDSQRERIAQAGRERCLRSGYDYASRMRQMLRQALE